MYFADPYATINSLSRRQLEDLLLGIDTQPYDHEDTETLREAVRVNFEDGTLDEELLDPEGD